jgi:hypothetical protein
MKFIPLILIFLLGNNYHSFQIDSASHETMKATEGTDTATGNTSSSNDTFNSTYLQAYYSNLNQNFGENVMSSCGYVALGMLLSYYDSFLSDDIIPEQYDVASVGSGTDMMERRNSPGVLYEKSGYDKQSKLSDYTNYLKTIKDRSLQAKLVGISDELKLTLSKKALTTSCGDRIKILNNYLSQTLDYSEGTKYTIEYIVKDTKTTSADIKNFITNKIKEGYPVLVGANSTTNKDSGHAFICYDCDDTSGEIYAHPGWHGKATHQTPNEIGYTKYKSAMILKFNIPHTHNNNYVINTSESSETYCYDDCRIKTSKTNNSHQYNRYEYTSSLKHKAYCRFCGSSTLKPHAILESSIYKVGLKSYGKCIDCKETIDITSSHYSTAPTSLTSISHTLDNGIHIIIDDDLDAYLAGTLY